MKKIEGKCAVFLDIDGTITYRNPIPSARVIETLQKVQRAGNKVILNTGRGYGNIHADMLEAVKPDMVISAMGQYIVSNGEVVRSVTFTEEMKKLALDTAEKNGFGGFIEGTESIYSVAYGPVEPWKVDLSSLVNAEEIPPEKMLKLCCVGQADAGTIGSLEKFFNIYQHKVYFESAIKGYSKAEGMLFAANLLNIPKSNCIAVGDSPNDMEMIQAAGIGVAMGNATEELKNAADIVTKSNAEDGVAVILEQLLEI